MQFSAHNPRLPTVMPRADRTTSVELKFTQTGKYLIAAGSDRPSGHESYHPVLYIGVMGKKGWATHYPMDGNFVNDDEAAAAALKYGIRIITGQAKWVFGPDESAL